MAKFERINRFHEYINICLLRRGLSASQVAEKLWGAKERRTWHWDMSHRPTKMQVKRESRLRELAELFQEPLSKLLFLCGSNPWANRVDLQKQWAIWEFVERIVRAKENGEGKPPSSAHTRLCNQIFGGAEVVTNVSAEEMASYLKGDDDETK